jgi:hypothetical protein
MEVRRTIIWRSGPGTIRPDDAAEDRAQGEAGILLHQLELLDHFHNHGGSRPNALTGWHQGASLGVNAAITFVEKIWFPERFSDSFDLAGQA